MFNFDYSGNVQSFNSSSSCGAGYYKLEVWGAQGGNADVSGYRGGYGAYSVGITKMNTSETIYVAVGQAGSGGSQITISEKFNGGGSVPIAQNNIRWASTGGGATHIATVSGQLRNLSIYKGSLVSNTYYNSESILIVAGGGGGAARFSTSTPSTGGNGGGIKGMVGNNPVNSAIANGGTQIGTGVVNDNSNTGGFGYGGSCCTCTECASAGGGGGWFGGNGGAYNITPGGGGSGYIGSSNLISSSTITKHMTCYSCSTSTEAATRTNSNTNVSATATADYSKTGNGYSRITYLGTSI